MSDGVRSNSSPVIVRLRGAMATPMLAVTNTVGVADDE